LAQQLLLERKETGLPPVTNWAVIRAEAQSRELANQFLEAIAAQLNQAAHPQVMVLGPVPSIMEKKAGRFRAQLLLTSSQRKPIHQVLDYHISAIERHKLARKVRWSIDIDPVDLL
jgi:primosomal protein N' (replication factor Y)